MITIPFDSGWKRIAISLSGGADSALLTYLLCKLITTQELHIINHVRCWKTKPWQADDAVRVYEWMQAEFPKIKMYRHVNFIPPEMEWGSNGPTMIDEYGKKVSGDNIEQRSYAEYIGNMYDIDIYFNAVTRNPRNVDFKGPFPRDIEPTDDNKHLELMTHMGKLAAHPFRFKEKSEIISEYKRQCIWDLFEITRSCEGTFDNLDYKNYKKGQYVPVCGECFWCKERDWAVAKNQQNTLKNNEF
jgi:hypothetical protein